MDQVSIVIPFYGNSQSKQLYLVTESMLSQKGIKTDLILSGINIATKVERLEDLSKHPIEVVPEIIRTGAVINNGLRKSSGEYIYVTDADILLPNSNYLENLLKYSKKVGTSFKRPPMRRLLVDDFNWIYELFKSKGLNFALDKLDYSQDYVVKPKGVDRSMRSFHKFENGRNKIFIASEKDFQEYVSNESNKGSEPRYFNQDRHCGGVFAPRSSFMQVGGYHEGFISWGVWDADIQWKLEKRYGMETIPNTNKFEVVHLDHERGYFSRKKWAHDKNLQDKRRKNGYKNCIREDLKTFLGGCYE